MKEMVGGSNVRNMVTASYHRMHDTRRQRQFPQVDCLPPLIAIRSLNQAADSRVKIIPAQFKVVFHGCSMMVMFRCHKNCNQASLQTKEGHLLGSLQESAFLSSKFSNRAIRECSPAFMLNQTNFWFGRKDIEPRMKLRVIGKVFIAYRSVEA